MSRRTGRVLRLLTSPTRSALRAVVRDCPYLVENYVSITKRVVSNSPPRARGNLDIPYRIVRTVVARRVL